MTPFLSMHWLALSSDYKMEHFIVDGCIILEYVPA